MTAQHSHYLESKILTAPPQRLHLMLLEGAIRFGRQAAEAQARGDEATAAAVLLRMIDIVGELVAGVRTQKSALNTTIADLYWFLFRRVSEAKINNDRAALAEALGILEYERETWQLVCEKLADSGAAKAPASNFLSGPHATKAGLSLEA